MGNHPLLNSGLWNSDSVDLILLPLVCDSCQSNQSISSIWKHNSFRMVMGPVRADAVQGYFWQDLIIFVSYWT